MQPAYEVLPDTVATSIQNWKTEFTKECSSFYKTKLDVKEWAKGERRDFNSFLHMHTVLQDKGELYAYIKKVEILQIT